MECGTPGKHGQTASVPVGLESSTETVPVMDHIMAEVTVQDRKTKTKNASLKNVQVAMFYITYTSIVRSRYLEHVLMCFFHTT